MKNIFKIVLCAIAICSASIAAAQSNMIDVVYCKNGAIIKGVIIEQIPNQQLKIQTADGSVFVYKMDEVEKMTKEQVQSATNNTSNFGMTQGFGLDNNTTDFCTLGREDAAKNYKAAEAGITTSLVTIFTGPIFGLIPAAIESGGAIPDHRLNYPDRELMKNSSYRDCYSQKAQEVKRKEVWDSYGGSVIAYILVGGLITVLAIVTN